MKLGQPSKHNKHWTAREEDELRLLWPVMASPKIAKLLRRSVEGVRGKAARMSLDCGRRWCDNEAGMWTVGDERRLAAMWSAGCSVRQIAMQLGRTEPAVRVMRLKLGLPRRKQRLDGQVIEAMVRRHATVREIADALGVKYSRVDQWLRLRGLREHAGCARRINKGALEELA